MAAQGAAAAFALPRRHMHRLHERPIPRRIPRSEPDPLLARYIHWNAKRMCAESGMLGGRDNLPVHLLTVAPYHLDEFEREGPLQVRDDGSLRTRAFDRIIPDEDLAARDEIIARADRAEHRTPVFVVSRHAIELQIIHAQIRVSLVVWKLRVSVALRNQILRTAPVIHVVQ